MITSLLERSPHLRAEVAPAPDHHDVLDGGGVGKRLVGVLLERPPVRA
jgi:hypothetical protein